MELDRRVIPAQVCESALSAFQISALSLSHVRPLHPHDRMPVILSPEHYQWWLEPKRFEPEFLKNLLRPYPAEDMACVRVSKLVNNAKHDSPDCLTPG
jgi:putative SOS response-associated peptidase YedK